MYIGPSGRYQFKISSEQLQLALTSSLKGGGGSGGGGGGEENKRELTKFRQSNGIA